jgi:hypothetical protein
MGVWDAINEKVVEAILQNAFSNLGGTPKTPQTNTFG